jgi:uncharacterized membrane protein (DUF2068 family)
VDWSLLGCGHAGHITYAPEEAELREQLSTRTAWGDAWQCLRCGTFVTGQPQATGPADQAPAVRRGVEIRSALILRFFAVERFARALIFGFFSYLVWRFRNSQESVEQSFRHELPIWRALLRQLGFNIDHSKLVGLIQHALTLSRTSIMVLAAILAAYALVEVIEGIGLWLVRRWGEYFAMVVTSLGLPYEIYDLAAKVTVTRLVLFAINLALVLYLVITKRLFGVRGGRAAFDAMLRSESIMQEAINAAAARRAAGPGRAAAATAGADPQPGSLPAEAADRAPAQRDAAAASQGTAAARQNAHPPGRQRPPPSRTS